MYLELYQLHETIGDAIRVKILYKIIASDGREIVNHLVI